MILYLTNRNAKNKNAIPSILRKVYKEKVYLFYDQPSLKLIKQKKINFIICDRFSFLLKEKSINFVNKKVINFHDSILPDIRGSYPVFWSIIFKKPIGFTVHYVNKKADKGDIIFQKKLLIKKKFKLSKIYDLLRLEKLNFIKKNWKKIINNSLKKKKQNQKITQFFYKNDFNKVKKLLETKKWNNTYEDIISMRNKIIKKYKNENI